MKLIPPPLYDLKKKILVFFFIICTCILGLAQTKEQKIDQLMTTWHHAAEVADFTTYFDLLDEHSIFMGTDATERWSKQEFMKYAAPAFDRTKRSSAWTYKAIQRTIYFSKDGKTAWIDELLEGPMKICRGSGVLQLEKGKWKIQQYVLSATIPNSKMKEVIQLKAEEEQKIIDGYKTSIKSKTNS